MFFRKKQKKEQDDSAPDNRRRHYRRAPGKKHSLGVILEGGARRNAKTGRFRSRPYTGPPRSGEIVDLSAGGSAIAFPANRDPKLTKGQVVSLKFSSLSHGGEIIVEARTVILTGSGKDDRRYSFEFLDIPGLFEQLDPYYSAFFNRREVVRARPALDRKLPIHLQTEDAGLDLKVNDISLKGVSVTRGLDRGALLDESSELKVQFTLPKTTTDIATKVTLRHSTTRGVSMCFGLEFTPENPEAIQHADFDAYMVRRIEEMARWDNH